LLLIIPLEALETSSNLSGHNITESDATRHRHRFLGPHERLIGLLEHIQDVLLLTQHLRVSASSSQLRAIPALVPNLATVETRAL